MALLKVAALAGCLSVAAADSKTCTPGCSATRGGDPCTTDANDPDDLTGSCFFNACTCEYRGTVSGCSTNDACAGWKQTGGCSASGSLEPDNHLACCEYVPTGASGYCECGTNGNKVREVGCGGRTDSFNCQAECEGAGYTDCAGGWGAWSACASMGGQRTRQYTVVTPAGTYGSACSAANGAVETEPCTSCGDLNGDGTADDAFECSTGTVNSAALGVGDTTGSGTECCDIDCVETENTAADCASVHSATGRGARPSKDRHAR